MMARSSVLGSIQGRRNFHARPQFSVQGVVAALLVLAAAVADAQPAYRAPLVGFVEELRIDDPADPWSGGTLEVGGQVVRLPRNLLIDLPAGRATVQQLLAQAPPACAALGESGLSRSDQCEGATPALVTVRANGAVCGSVVAGEVHLVQSPASLSGEVSFIHHAEGYLELNGEPGVANTGSMLRINDPQGRFSIQQGRGCAGGSNCSPDLRFAADRDNYSVTFSTGYPACLPSTQVGGLRSSGSDAFGVGDPLCPASNRASTPVADSTRFAPIQLGDRLRAEGHHAQAAGVAFFSAHTLEVAQALITRDDPSQPDYLAVSEAHWSVPSFELTERPGLELEIAGSTTLEASAFDVYARHFDAVANAPQELPLASTVGNPQTLFRDAQGQVRGLFSIHLAVDLLNQGPVVAPEVSACLNLRHAGFSACPGSGTLAEEVAVLDPLSREIVARTRHGQSLLEAVVSLDVQGKPAPNGAYTTPVSLAFPIPAETDLNALDSPFVFAGVPWNLDRRLSPEGCLDSDGDGVLNCEANPQPLDPFPFSGLDPSSHSLLPIEVRQRVFAHAPFGPGDLLSWPPSDTCASGGGDSGGAGTPPGASLVAVSDIVATRQNVTLFLEAAALLRNDRNEAGGALLFADADATSINGGSVIDNGDGTLAYIPPPNFAGEDAFSYRISDGLGASVFGAVLITVLPEVIVRPPAPQSLKTVSVIDPPNLSEFVLDRDVAIALGKALFWDQQVGSTGRQACATCHYHAGADARTSNTMHPGPNGVFEVRGPEQTLRLSDFPFHLLANPDLRGGRVLRDRDDIVGSQGVVRKLFAGIVIRPNGIALRRDASVTHPDFEPDPVFSVAGVNARQVTGRNTPTVINAVFNHRNFWDGRANHHFNGSSPFGARDSKAGVWVEQDGQMVVQSVRMARSSLASQATGPATNEVEMSWQGRSFPELGRKMLNLKRPLRAQRVVQTDSVLGPYVGPAEKGLLVDYAFLIAGAFQSRLWSSLQAVSIDGQEYSQMEANFALFWGLAIQLYEATLVSDDSPFDRFMEGDSSALTQNQREGLDIFLGVGRCIQCHSGPEFTQATTRLLRAFPEVGNFEGEIERMQMGDLGTALYDNGYYNIGVRPTTEDPGVGGSDPFGNPLSFTQQAVDGVFVDAIEPNACSFLVGSCLGIQPGERVAVAGSFKTPSLRNVELTGPYMHNGGMATLEQVVEFYTRGGDFRNENIDNLAPGYDAIPFLIGRPTRKAKLVDFLKALTDDRVRHQRAPFDHPSLRLPGGERIPAVGAEGGAPIEAFSPPL